MENNKFKLPELEEISRPGFGISLDFIDSLNEICAEAESGKHVHAYAKEFEAFYEQLQKSDEDLETKGQQLAQWLEEHKENLWNWNTWRTIINNFYTRVLPQNESTRELRDWALKSIYYNKVEMEKRNRNKRTLGYLPEMFDYIRQQPEIDRFAIAKMLFVVLGDDLTRPEREELSELMPYPRIDNETPRDKRIHAAINALLADRNFPLNQGKQWWVVWHILRLTVGGKWNDIGKSEFVTYMAQWGYDMQKPTCTSENIRKAESGKEAYDTALLETSPEGWPDLLGTLKGYDEKACNLGIRFMALLREYGAIIPDTKE